MQGLFRPAGEGFEQGQHGRKDGTADIRVGLGFFVGEQLQGIILIEGGEEIHHLRQL